MKIRFLYPLKRGKIEIPLSTVCVMQAVLWFLTVVSVASDVPHGVATEPANWICARETFRLISFTSWSPGLLFSIFCYLPSPSKTTFISIVTATAPLLSSCNIYIARIRQYQEIALVVYISFSCIHYLSDYFNCIIGSVKLESSDFLWYIVLFRLQEKNLNLNRDSNLGSLDH